MVLTGILVGIILILANLAILYLVYRKYREEKARLLFYIRAFFESPDPDKPSEFSSVVAQISQQFASTLLQTMKQSALGSASGEARNRAKLEGALAQDIASQQNPVLGAILNQFPKASKLAEKNPQMLSMLASIIPKLTGGPGPGPGPGPGHIDNGNSDYASRLKSYQ